MPVYNYQAESQGKIIKGKMKAPTVQAVNMKLKAQGMEPIYVMEKSLMAFASGGKGVKTKDLLFFTRQLAFLLTSGVSLIQALNMCENLTANLRLKSVLKDLIKDVEGGKSFSRSLYRKPNVFDGFYVNMVACAEETGLLDKVLGDLADYIEKSESVKSKVRSAMMYPAIVLAISFSIIIGIIVVIVPKFESLYASSKGAELPALTQAFVNLSHALREQWLLIAFAAAGIPFLLWQYFRTESGHAQKAALIKMLPLFSGLFYKSALARFCRSFFSLLKAGVNFLDALEAAKNIAMHNDLTRGLNTAKNFISQGKGFAKGLRHSKMFPDLIVNMTEVAEESGKIDETYEKLTVYYEEDLNNTIAGLIKMIEPILIVFLGGAIGIIILALYLPVFQMGDVVG